MMDDIFHTLFSGPNNNPDHGGSRESRKEHHADREGDHDSAEQNDVIDVDAAEVINVDEEEEGLFNRHRNYADETLFGDRDNHTDGIEERKETRAVDGNIARKITLKQRLIKNDAGEFHRRYRQDATRRARETLESKRAAATSWKPGWVIFVEPVVEMWECECFRRGHTAWMGT